MKILIVFGLPTKIYLFHENSVFLQSPQMVAVHLPSYSG